VSDGLTKFFDIDFVLRGFEGQASSHGILHL
jgi:hypothetical protein